MVVDLMLVQGIHYFITLKLKYLIVFKNGKSIKKPSSIKRMAFYYYE